MRCVNLRVLPAKSFQRRKRKTSWGEAESMDLGKERELRNIAVPTPDMFSGTERQT